MIDSKKNPHAQPYAFRYKIFSAFFLFLFSILAIRALELAVASPLPASVITQPQQVRRGIIFDAQGHELAVSRDTFSIGVKPPEIVQPEETSRILAQLLKLDQVSLLARLKAGDKFFYLKRRIPLEDTESLRRLNLAGLLIQSEPDRYYPNKRLASQLLGFTGLDGEGLSGIEFHQNAVLTRDTGQDFVGHNIHLSVNSFVQHQLERTLEEGLESSNSKHAMGVIIETTTGRVLAMASLPDFDPNAPKNSPDENFRNHVISFQYEPGSTFKIFTMASLLRENLLDDEKIYNCPGFFDYKGRRVSCGHEHGKQTFLEVMKNSCNYGVISASWDIPTLKLYENLRAFGFNSLTEISLPGETKGLLASPKDWDYYLKMTVPIGHGVSVTPIQLAIAANSIANDGNLMTPILIEKVTDAQGKTIDKNAPITRVRVIAAEHAKKIRTYLREVVKSGTGTGADLGLKDYDVCGKTGTSIKSSSKGYDAKRYQASFVGFFPCDKPEITIMLMFDEPRGEFHQGATVAAPAFRRVLREIIPSIHVGEVKRVAALPTPAFASVSHVSGRMSDFRGLSKKELLFQVLSKFPGDHEIKGSGYVTHQNPAPDTGVNPPYHFSFTLSFPDDE